MRARFTASLAISAFGLLSPQLVLAQGTITYLSNLGQASAGSVAAGSDSWYAADFITGNNSGGYLLNDIQLAMTDASGNPSGFQATLYSAIGNTGAFPGNSLGTLNGSLNPVTGNVYAYTPASSLILAPNTYYFIVETAGTQLAAGSYNWSVTSTPSPGYTSAHWGGELFFAYSSDGLNWGYTSGMYGQFALDATPAPEPSVVTLMGLGGIVLLGLRRWKAKLAP